MASDVVLDASVIVKWYLQEQESPTALVFKERLSAGRIRAILPEFGLLEILNALVFKRYFANPGALAPSALLAETHRLLELIPLSDSSLLQTIRLSQQHGLSVYDASYLTLSLERNLQYITADYRATPRMSAFQNIVELRSVS